MWGRPVCRPNFFDIMNIKNIVFDFGNVIRLYDTDEMLNCFSLSDIEKEIFNEKIFNSPKWADCDRGYGYKDVVFAEEVEEFSENLKNVFYSLVARYDFEIKFMHENAGICELISKLKDRGYCIYLLSNIGLGFHVFRRELPIFRLFDGVLPSCDYGIIKPDKRIFQVLFDKFSLKPEECLFIDDNPTNIKSSIDCNMNAICYNALNESVKELEEYLREKGINIGC